MDIEKIRYLFYTKNRFSKNYWKDLGIKDRIWEYLMGYTDDIDKIYRYLETMVYPPLKWFRNDVIIEKKEVYYGNKNDKN